MKKVSYVNLFTVIIVGLVAGVVYYKSGDMKSSGNMNNTNSTLNNLNNTKISSIELSRHNVKPDCWISYQGKVYDITLFLPKHPGTSDAIAPYCGTSSEFEKAFANQHGTSQVSLLIKEGIYKGELMK